MVAVAINDDLSERIRHTEQRSLLLLHLFIVRQSVGRLDIQPLVMPVHHEIHLQTAPVLLTLLITLHHLHHTHINGKAHSAQLIVNDIFHRVVELYLAETYDRIPYANIFEIVFRLSADNSASRPANQATPLLADRHTDSTAQVQHAFHHQSPHNIP